MKYIIVLIVYIVYIIHPPLQVWGFSSYCPLSKGTSAAEGLAGCVSGVIPHFTYIFLHTNIFHLLINSISLLTAWIMMQRFYKRWYFFAVSFLLAVATSFIPLCIFDKPTVGASGVVYAMIGMILPYYHFKKAHVFYLSIFISLVVSFFLKNSNFYLHLFCFIGGVLFTIIHKQLSNLSVEINRYYQND